MKRFILLTVFTFSAFAASAQYGKLQPFKPGDTLMVMRTAAHVIDSLIKTNNGKIIRQAGLIEHIEEVLEVRRKRFVNEHKTSGYDGNIEGEIGILQRENLPDARYYIKEYMIYNPDFPAAKR